MVAGIIIGFMCGAFLWFPLGVWFISLFRNLEPEIHNETLRKVVGAVIRSTKTEMQDTQESELESSSPMEDVYNRR